MNIYYAPNFRPALNLRFSATGGHKLFINVTLVFSSFLITLYLLTSRKTDWYNIHALIQFCFLNIFAHASLCI